MRPSSRLERIPPYLFAQLERKIAEKKAKGIDVISLGIGDPDTPTPQVVVDALREAAGDPGTHRYPSNRGRQEFRDAVAAFYARRFGVELDPATEIIPALGAKECIFNLNLAFLDPGDQVFSLSKGYNMTGWRAAAIGGNANAIEQYWRLKTNIDSGMFDAVQLAAAAALEHGDAAAREMAAIYERRRDLVCGALEEI